VLRDIDFSIDEGETLGIIGRNGAGKSTLLKILSRITKPTLGRAEINGRVGSLLEVGTGFHSELSGRENIFLNGAILGMRRTEIQKKFDEIVAFSEIEKFLDTPVKHYSSGMYMRLAFAVAAHLEPEVLIVDEVLAVGDAMFQKKCLAKMHDVSEEGRTVIFVSHDLNAVTRLCRKVIWLDSGRLKLAGDAGEVTSAYLFEQELTGSERIWNETDAPGNEVARLLRVRAVDENNHTSSAFEIGKEVWIEMTYDVLQSDKVLIPNVHFFNAQGYCLFVSHDWHGGWRDRPRPRGRYVSKVRVPNNFLTEGPLHIGAALTTYSPLEVHFVEWNAISFNMIDNGDDPNSTRGDFTGEIPGVIRPLLDWETEFSG
jgi:lipopolysaccharide transport system ATP-binding protein